MADPNPAHGRDRGLRKGFSRRGRDGHNRQRGHHESGRSLQVYDGNSDCAVCKTTLVSVCHNQFHFKFDVDFKLWKQASKEKRREYLQTLLQMANTLLNEGGGYILVHIDRLSVAFFDEQVDARLMDLVGDGSMFDENFERQVIDKDHIVLRILRPQFSVCDFKSMMSMDKGRAKINYVQMKHLLTRPRLQLLPLQSDVSQMQLCEGHTYLLHESRSMQAKAVKPKDLQSCEGHTTGEKLFHLCWTSLELPTFVTAFSKQPQGGYYYLGLEEEKTKRGQKWEPVEQTGGFSCIFETKKLWHDKENKSIVHIARDEDVPGYEDRTGRYICRGVRLSPQDQQSFRKLLDHHVASDLYWHPDQPNQPLVHCSFYRVLEPVSTSEDLQNEGAVGGVGGQPVVEWLDRNLFLVEIKVDYYPGVCFHDSEGPEAFQFQYRDNPSKGQVERVSTKHCCELLATGRQF